MEAQSKSQPYFSASAFTSSGASSDLCHSITVFRLPIEIIEDCLTKLTNYNDNEIVKTLQSAEAKTHFSSVLRDVEAGNEVAIVYGKRKETVAVIIPYEQKKKNKKRQLGTLEGKVSVKFAEDFAMTGEELINS
jgi:antitoxin (DNA-binding transcriptional repressor) of toxin-antitoxin stability system